MGETEREEGENEEEERERERRRNCCKLLMLLEWPCSPCLTFALYGDFMFWQHKSAAHTISVKRPDLNRSQIEIS